MSTIIEMKGIEKFFPGVHALKKCEFSLEQGEVHALIGENGAGKSTLMKILTGVYNKNEGEIYVDGQLVEVKNTKYAQELGISIIHQELNLMTDLTVAENIYIGKEPKRNGIFLDNRQLNNKTREILQSMNIYIEPTTKVEDLTVAQQQMVEIAKALSYDSRVLILDEPTAALTESEIETLFRMIRELKAKGVAMVYISHRMEELKQICDRVTVMRDGEYIDCRNMSEVTIDEIIKMMVGREIFATAHESKATGNEETILEVKNLNRKKAVKDVSFHLKRGEILGFAGLMGAGRTEVARCIFGADSIDSGEILLKGEKVNISSPKKAVEHGIGYLSEDRKRYGLVLGLDVESNITMSTMNKFVSNGFWLKDGTARTNAENYIRALAIKTPSGKQLVQNLSGGNQQKVVIAKWLTRDCDVLIFDEPTRGIDVGAKSEIYKLLNELADQGKSIIMISSDLPEVLRMSHRVMVMCEGRITGELTKEEATQEKIMTLATDRSA